MNQYNTTFDEKVVGGVLHFEEMLEMELENERKKQMQQLVDESTQSEVIKVIREKKPFLKRSSQNCEKSNNETCPCKSSSSSEKSKSKSVMRKMKQEIQYGNQNESIAYFSYYPGGPLCNPMEEKPIFANKEAFEEMIKRELENQANQMQDDQVDQEGKKPYLKRPDVDSDSIVECDKCKRKFLGSCFNYHTKRCSGGKVFQPRMNESVKSLLGYDYALKIEKRSRIKSKKPAIWKKQHEELQELMRNCKKTPYEWIENTVKPVMPKEKHPSSHTIKLIDIADSCKYF